MKFPSLLRTPKYQRFSINPRYYDPVKEEIESRTMRIKRELEADGKLGGHQDEYVPSRLEGSFKSRRSKSRGVSFMQLIIMLLLTVGFIGYLYIGNTAIYLFALVSSVLLYLKVKRII